MKKNAVCVCITFLLTVSYSTSLLATDDSNKRKDAVLITSVHVDFNTNRINITGQNFLGESGHRVPSVLLGTMVLTELPPVTADHIEVQLPPNLTAGTYLLTVTNGPGEDSFSTFDVAIGAVGPQGPKGDSGPAGAQGPQGIPGLLNITYNTGSLNMSQLQTNSTAELTVACPSQSKIIGGGYVISTEPSLVIVPIANYPASSNQWLVRVQNQGGNPASFILTGYGICASVP